MQKQDQWNCRYGDCIISALSYDDYECRNLIVANDNSIEEMLIGIARAFADGVVTTKLISDPWIGGLVGSCLYIADRVTSKMVESMFPDIPDGVYTIETVTQHEERGYTYSYTYKLYYIEGIDVSGCDYYALWREITLRTQFDYQFDSNVLAERTK